MSLIKTTVELRPMSDILAGLGLPAFLTGQEDVCVFTAEEDGTSLIALNDVARLMDELDCKHYRRTIEKLYDFACRGGKRYPKTNRALCQNYDDIFLRNTRLYNRNATTLTLLPLSTLPDYFIEFDEELLAMRVDTVKGGAPASAVVLIPADESVGEDTSITVATPWGGEEDVVLEKVTVNNNNKNGGTFYHIPQLAEELKYADFHITRVAAQSKMVIDMETGNRLIHEKYLPQVLEERAAAESSKRRRERDEEDDDATNMRKRRRIIEDEEDEEDEDSEEELSPFRVVVPPHSHDRKEEEEELLSPFSVVVPHEEEEEEELSPFRVVVPHREPSVPHKGEEQQDREEELSVPHKGDEEEPAAPPYGGDMMVAANEDSETTTEALTRAARDVMRALGMSETMVSNIKGSEAVSSSFKLASAVMGNIIPNVK